eukprot:m.29886 g.29886  ORF g.29886 m.29886 type:complete len:85 (-) comp12168_c0_seq1:70-324(-)
MAASEATSSAQKATDRPPDAVAPTAPKIFCVLVAADFFGQLSITFLALNDVLRFLAGCRADQNGRALSTGTDHVSSPTRRQDKR